MRRLILVAILALSPLAAQAQTDQQALVDRSTLTVQEMLTPESNPDAKKLMKDAKGVMVCPQIFKAGFILGGQGGSCVLVGRTQGGWTSPAFFGLASGSIGFQIGIQDAQIIFIILTDKGLRALINSQFKIGADASVAVATLGAGISGATTAAMRADIVAFSLTRGLFAGISLDGSLISARPESNAAYYGQSLSAQQIVLENQGQNQGAEPLKDMLTRVGGG
jgi:lipid-binding SYLF domain-containing protein